MWVPTPPKKEDKVEIQDKKGSGGISGSGKRNSFKRVDDQFWGEKANKDVGAMADNRCEGVFGEEGFGARASARLLKAQGKRFQHKKTKAKRSYNGFAKTGQGISMKSNSTNNLLGLFDSVLCAMAIV